MKLARPIGLCFFVIAALVQMPTGASAAPVSTITLPSGTWSVTVAVTGKAADNYLAFGMTSPQEFPICPTGESFDCAAGYTHTFSDLSGELVFYLTDVTCEQTFQSTEAASARIDQIDATHWTIGWDDAGNCVDPGDGDFNDLTASVVADSVTPTSGGVDFAAGNYDGVTELVISTVFGPRGDSMQSKIIVPPPCVLPAACDPYQAGPVTDEEISAKDPLYITFCGNAQCDAQVDVSLLPSGSQPDLPITVILTYKDDALKGDAVYAQGDGDTTSFLLDPCDSLTVARVGGFPAKCVASITMTKGNDKIKTVVVLVASGGDPIIGKR